MQFDRVSAEVKKANARWTPRRTNLGELPPEELKRRLGFVPPPGKPSLQQREVMAQEQMAVLRKGIQAAPAPPSVDWRSQNGMNFVTAVRDQGPCGSCVAFGTIAGTEAC